MCVRVRECQEAGARLVVDGVGRLLHGAGYYSTNTVQDIDIIIDYVPPFCRSWFIICSISLNFVSISFLIRSASSRSARCCSENAAI